MEQLAAGCCLLDVDPHLKDPLCKYLAAFKLVRTVERSVEGVHAVITKLVKRAPAAKIAYLSLDLRFHMLKPILSELAFCPSATGFISVGEVHRLPLPLP